MQDVEARIARLERTARRWRIAAVGLMAVMGTGLLMGQIRMTGEGINTNKLTAGTVAATGVTADVVTAKKIVITDADGNERVSAGTENTGSPFVEMKDKGGKTLLAIGTDGKNGTLVIMDAQGKKLFAAP